MMTLIDQARSSPFRLYLIPSAYILESVPHLYYNLTAKSSFETLPDSKLTRHRRPFSGYKYCCGSHSRRDSLGGIKPQQC